MEVNARNAVSNIWEKLAKTGAKYLRERVNMHGTPKMGVSQLLESKRRTSIIVAVPSEFVRTPFNPYVSKGITGCGCHNIGEVGAEWESFPKIRVITIIKKSMKDSKTFLESSIV